MQSVGFTFITIKIIGAGFIFFGLANGYVALQGVTDPEFFILVNGRKHADLEAKYLYLASHLLIILIGVALSLISAKQIAALQDIRHKFWAIFRK